MARKLKKRRNEQGDSITLNFHASDPQEAAALAMSKRLAGIERQAKGICCGAAGGR